MTLVILDPSCDHAPVGYVCWPATYDPQLPHASTHCCGRAACVEDAADWVEAHTGHRGEFHPFKLVRESQQ